ncbi:flavin reductase (NADPH) [Oxyura jamaicensis]|uniref:flavin reductase (NADPH) n=1 Tax=Oxyura jamaicensis TaxID=8884 RepID=UPI0015A6A95C|nr:flavin reductase (NADPH) [Oxyura jamaicensis]
MGWTEPIWGRRSRYGAARADTGQTGPLWGQHSSPTANTAPIGHVEPLWGRHRCHRAGGPHRAPTQPPSPIPPPISPPISPGIGLRGRGGGAESRPEMLSHGPAVAPLPPPPGYTVTVLVRDPGRLPPQAPPPARVVVGDVLEPADVAEAVRGQDAVVIILGTRNDLGPTTVMSEGTKNIVAAMKAHGVRKVVACLSAFLLWDLQKVPPRLLPVTEDHIRMHRVLQDSGLDCVAVMPPHIADDQPLTGDYTVSVGATAGGSRVISKHDLGHFLLRCLHTSEYDGKGVYVCGHYPKA